MYFFCSYRLEYISLSKQINESETVKESSACVDKLPKTEESTMNSQRVSLSRSTRSQVDDLTREDIPQVILIFRLTYFPL